jgi:uncharacterized RDD family membrane protein YckC
MAERLAARRLPRTTAADAMADDAGRGVLGARAIAYLIDSIVLAIFAVAFIGLGFVNLLLQSDAGLEDPPDSALWQFVYISLLSIPAWAVLNLVLLRKRGQSIGQYVMGLAVTTEGGFIPGLPTLVAYLLALHPLVFHPILAGFWAILAGVALSLTENDVLVFGSLAVAILSCVAPLVALMTGAAGRGRRALHDRIAGTVVVPLE